MRNARITAVAMLFAVTTATACSSSAPKAKPSVTPPTSTPATARIDTTPDQNVGLVQGMLGGSTGGGIAMATNTTGARYTTSAGVDGHFLLRLPPGRYKVVGRSFPLYSDGRIDCTAPERIVVRTGVTTPINLWCAGR